MSEALSSIGTFLGSNLGKGVLTAGTAGAGLLQNLSAYRKQKQVQDMISDPKKFNAMVAATEQPLSQGLTADVARQSDAYGAERGLGSSPYIMKDVYAQALAPFYLQQQQQAMNNVLSRLGLLAQHPAQPIDVTSIFKALGTMGTKPVTGTTPSGDMNPFSMGETMTLPTPAVDFNTGDFGSLVPSFGGGDMGMAG